MPFPFRASQFFVLQPFGEDCDTFALSTRMTVSPMQQTEWIARSAGNSSSKCHGSVMGRGDTPPRERRQCLSHHFWRIAANFRVNRRPFIGGSSMKKTIWLATTALVAMSVVAAPAMAGRSSHDQRASEIADLKARLEKLEQEAAIAKAEAEDAAIATSSRLKQIEDTQYAVQWSFADGRPSVRSGDGRFELAFRGRVQMDWASFMQDQNDFGAGYGTVGSCAASNALCDLGSGSVFRRIRFGVEGKFFRDFIYELRFDFGGSDQEGAGTNVIRNHAQ